MLKLDFLNLFWTMGERIEKNQKVAHLAWKMSLRVTERNQSMRNGRSFQRDKQCNLGLPTKSVIFLIFLMYFLDRSFPKLSWVELFAEESQQWQCQKKKKKSWLFERDTISLIVCQCPHYSQFIFSLPFAHLKMI